MALLHLNDDRLVRLLLLLLMMLLLDLGGLQHLGHVDAAGRGKVDGVAGVVRLQVSLEVISPAVRLVAKCAGEWSDA